MNRKTAFCIGVVVLLGVGVGPAGAGPVGHWAFDDGSGTVAKDSSGNNFNGKLLGDPTWVAGKVGSGALSFDGSDGLVEVAEGPKLDMDTMFSIAAWVNLPSFSTYYFIVCKSPSGTAAANYPGNYEFRVESQTGVLQLLHQISEGQELSTYVSSTPITAGQWHHVAVTLKKGGRVEFYIDGAPAGGAAQTTNFGILNNEPVRIGGRKDNYSYFNGQIDDVYLYDRVLTAAQIEGLAGGVEPAFLKAEMPKPAAGEVVDQTMAILSWRAGDLAASHKVYISESFDDVSEGRVEPIVATATMLMVGITPPYATGLTPGKTYYWRVDEINDSKPGSPWQGDIWSFRVRPSIAWDPAPADGTKFVSTAQSLSWQKGLGTIFHTVHFGTSLEEVSNSTTGWMTVEATYKPSAPMELDKTYYWRVDEFVGTGSRKGDVWSFTTVPPIAIADASLLGHWTFDEANAGSAVDWSGHGLHGVIYGTPGWTDGAAGGATVLDGVDDYFLTSAPADVNLASATMTAWVKPSKVHGMAGILFHRGGAVCGLNLAANNRLGYHWAVAGTWGFNSGLVLPTNEWSFVAVVVQPDKATLYLDGGDIWVANAIAHPAAVFNTGLMLGFDPAVADRHFAGAMDDLRLYTKAMTADEIDKVMSEGSKPESVEDPMMIESFDSYNAYNVDTGDNVWDVWSDGYGGNGTGSTIGHAVVPSMERVQTVGGHQSAPMYYDNSGAFADMDGKAVTAKYSEISRPFSPAQDFTRGGAVSLVLWVRGVAANTAEATDVLYVVLDDGVKSATVKLAQPDDLKFAGWRKYQVALAGLAVNAKKVTKLTIGIGTPGAAAPGGKGMVYLDNIALETE